MRFQLTLLLLILNGFTRLAAAQMYPPQPGDLKLTTSFDFLMGNQVVSAGNHIVRWDRAINQLQICEDGIDCRATQVIVTTVSDVPTQPTLFFRNRAGHQLLDQIRFPDGTGLRLSQEATASQVQDTGSQAAISLNAELLCIHQSAGLLPSWH